VRCHISRPVFGEGRQTPDRQLFFVNGRPCGLPQIAKAINEVYKGFNVSQSPFIFADFQMDTNGYDVNVSPDKRTILLHNSAALIETLKNALTDLFEKQDQTVPQSYIQTARLKQPNIQQQELVDPHDSIGPPQHLSRTPDSARIPQDNTSADQREIDENEPKRLVHDHFRNQTSTRERPVTKAKEENEAKRQRDQQKRAEKLATTLAEHVKAAERLDEFDDVREMQAPNYDTSEEPGEILRDIRVKDFNERMAEQQRARARKDATDEDAPLDAEAASQESTTEQPNVVQNAFDRMRPTRSPAEIATITIGKKTITTVVGSQFPRRPSHVDLDNFTPKSKRSTSKLIKNTMAEQFSHSLRKFGSHGTKEDENLSDSLREEGGQGSGDIEDDDADDIANDGNETGDDADDIEDDADDIANDADDRTNKENETKPFYRVPQQRHQPSEDSDSDPEYVDEVEKKAEEEAKVAALIRAAEESAATPSKKNLKRANRSLGNGAGNDSTLRLLTDVELDLTDLEDQALSIRKLNFLMTKDEIIADAIQNARSEEERLSLTVSKDDFPNMHIIGQFNLGFILAVRPRSSPSLTDTAGKTAHDSDELFIIDQHASDEKYNFERLQAETVVGNQRLVRPGTLDLTAVEEEVVLENLSALEKNGFIIEVDTSGEQPVGQRCKLLSLPLSKEVVFDSRDLEELLHLLAEWPSLGPDSVNVPRPTKVRKMFAMRACRSSIMIGKTLSKRQMKDVLEHMGKIDKPWNCPHGRPTMRHLTSLESIGGWKEWDGRGRLGEVNADGRGRETDVWSRYIE
jgi:DNA mismatch repair protein PMS2